ncbi:MAG: regulator of replication initiation timing [Roseivirga sp.]|jgi:regulator of replication initiation timing
MSGETKKKGSNKDSIRIILVIALIIIAAGSGYKIYTDSIAQDELQAEFDQTKATITTKLDSISGQLSSRISEIARLGGNIDSLVTLKDSIIAQRDQLQRTRTANKAIINRLDRKVTGYEELLLAKDDEIEALKVINSKLLVENTELKVEKNELNATIREANQTQQKLEQKVSLAAKLNAENIKVFNVNSRGKEREGDFRSRQAEKIKVTFNLSENAVAPIAGHKIMIQIVDPAGNVVFDIARGSGSYQVDGREQFYTSIQEILFDNSKQALSFVYDKGSEFDKGDYKINIISDFYQIGQVGFNVR